MPFVPKKKRQKQINKLTKRAVKLWELQRELSGKAGELAVEAGQQVGKYAEETVVPEVTKAGEKAVRGGQQALHGATTGWNSAVVPAIATGLGAVASMLSVGKDKAVKGAIKDVTSFLTVPEVAAPKKKSSWGKWLLVGAGVAAAAGVAYVAWQTLRADDDLWIPDADEIEPKKSAQAKATEIKNNVAAKAEELKENVQQRLPRPDQPADTSKTQPTAGKAESVGGDSDPDLGKQPNN